MSKHTPGPWLLEDRIIKYIISKPGDGYITRDVCRLDSSTMAAFAQEANALLIAAAPELLAALIALERTAGIPAMNDDPVRVKARAAIAKATGGGE